VIIYFFYKGMIHSYQLMQKTKEIYLFFNSYEMYLYIAKIYVFYSLLNYSKNNFIRHQFCHCPELAGYYTLDKMNVQDS